MQRLQPLGHPELQLADSMRFQPSSAASASPDHQVGTKAQHLQRSAYPRRQVIQRGLADQQQGKPSEKATLSPGWA